MDLDNSNGINDNSESGECDSPLMLGDENTNNTLDFDSGSKQSQQSVNSERTNIDALDDSARDTLIIPPTDDSSQSTKSTKPSGGASSQLDLSKEHDILDFEGDDNELDAKDSYSNDAGEIDDMEDGEEGEVEEDRSSKESDDSNSPVAGEALEEGECDDRKPRESKVKKSVPRAEGEDELEEGEVSDDEDRNNTEPKAICRFFGKGQCTWGSNCRFLHPGVTDKGLYTMFDTVRPLLPLPPCPNSAYPVLVLPGRPFLMSPVEPVIESPWERGVRNAKEIIKESARKRETDVDFEEKKMNLSLSQEELDKENDYYIRKPESPVPVDPYDTDEFEPPADWNTESQVTVATQSTSSKTSIDAEFVHDRAHGIKRVREAPPRDSPHRREAPPLHEPEVRMVRESALLRRNRFERYPSSQSQSYDNPLKAEEWHDPWMRSKSPNRSRKDSSASKRSYSSGSSKSSSRSKSSSPSSRSSRSSRSSSNSSKSSTSSKSPSPKKRKTGDEVVRKAPPRRSPKPMRIAPPPPPHEEFVGRRRSPGGFRNAMYNRGSRPRYAPSPPRPAGNQRGNDFNRRGRPLQSARVRRMKARNSSSSRSRSRSRSSSSDSSKSRSRSPWTESRSRSKSPLKTRKTFSRDKSTSRSRSRSSNASSTSRSRSASVSSASSGILGVKRAAGRKRTLGERESSVTVVDVVPPAKQTKSESNPNKVSSKEKGKEKEKEKKKEKEEEEGKEKEKGKEKGKGKEKEKEKEQSKTSTEAKEQLPKSKIQMTVKRATGFQANKNVLDRLAKTLEENFHGPCIDAEVPELPRYSPTHRSSEYNQKLSYTLPAPPVHPPDDDLDPEEKQRRREELLRQLKAVEDAIAKKRLKLDAEN